MLEKKLIRTKPQHVKEGIARKGANPNLVDEALRLDAEHRVLLKQIQALREKRNIAAKHQSGEVDQGKQIKAELRQLEPEAEKARLKLHTILHEIPNLPLSQVPEGKSEKDNVVVRTWGKPTQFDFAP
jgi:seryl-tRNA synthetase